ncbi:MAG: DUF86 domain-containing protein [Candidatus Omnitrophota bacterium]|jgi:hypothetical protein
MKKKRASNLYIRDILDSIKSIREYTNGLSFKEFRSKKIVIDAVVRNFEIIGEAAKNVPENIKCMYPEIPWKEMSGMRNKITHEYFGIDLDIVWKTIQGLPNLEVVFKNIYYAKKK